MNKYKEAINFLKGYKLSELYDTKIPFKDSFTTMKEQICILEEDTKQLKQKNMELQAKPMINNKGCEICNSDALTMVGLVNHWNNWKVSIYSGNGSVPKEERFKFCPNCGKELIDYDWGDAE